MWFDPRSLVKKFSHNLCIDFKGFSCANADERGIYADGKKFNDNHHVHIFWSSFVKLSSASIFSFYLPLPAELKIFAAD